MSRINLTQQEQPNLTFVRHLFVYEVYNFGLQNLLIRLAKPDNIRCKSSQIKKIQNSIAIVTNFNKINRSDNSY